MDTTLPVLAGTVSTIVFVGSVLPMLHKAFRTRELSSYSPGNIVLANVGNTVHSVYVFALPPGPIWVLHTFYLFSSALMLHWYLRYRRRPEGRRTPGGRRSAAMTLVSQLTALADRIPLPAETLGGVAVGAVAQRMRPVSLPPAARPAGIVCAVAGTGLVAVAWRERGPGDLEHPIALVTTGVHARSRNPIYFGFTLAHLGLALATRNGWVLATCPVSAVLVHRWLPREEALLHDLFGAEYDAYRARVPRYLGRRSSSP